MAYVNMAPVNKSANKPLNRQSNMVFRLSCKLIIFHLISTRMCLLFSKPNSNVHDSLLYRIDWTVVTDKVLKINSTECSIGIGPILKLLFTLVGIYL